MKTSILHILMGVLLMTTLGAAPNPAPESVYTDLTGKRCKTVEVSEEEQFSRQRCTGVSGYQLEIIEGDLRQTVNIISPHGAKAELDLQGNVSSAFSSLGAQAEWRVLRQGKTVTPQALIVRFNASENPENTLNVKSYLVVAKITANETCVTDVVSPRRNQNAEARRLADMAATRPCKMQPAE